jgi:hypothetical protein
MLPARSVFRHHLDERGSRGEAPSPARVRAGWRKHNPGRGHITTADDTPERYADGKPYYGDAVRVTYSVGLANDGAPSLAQANWGVAWPHHYAAAARALREAGIFPAGPVHVMMLGWDHPAELEPEDMSDRITLTGKRDDKRFTVRPEWQS